MCLSHVSSIFKKKIGPKTFGPHCVCIKFMFTTYQYQTPFT